MKITDMISISELARLLNKSRPTVYKYVSDYENGSFSGLPLSVKKLFDEIKSGNIPKREIYEYCEHWFSLEGRVAAKGKKEKTVGLKEIVKLLKEHQAKIDFRKLRDYIEKEIEK